MAGLTENFPPAEVVLVLWKAELSGLSAGLLPQLLGIADAAGPGTTLRERPHTVPLSDFQIPPLK